MFQKSWLMSKFWKYIDFGHNSEKEQFWSKSLKTWILIKMIAKSWFWSKLPKNPHFGEIFREISILVKISKNLNYVKLSKNPDLGLNFFRKIAILVIIVQNLDFGEDFRNALILLKKNCWKYKFWTKFSKKSDFVKDSRKFQVVA